MALTMSAGDHTRFLGLADYEWSAIGSLATALAAAIALLLPIALELRARWRDRRETRARLQNIVDGAYVGVGILARGLRAWCEKDVLELHNQLSWSIGVSKRLDLYARNGALQDDLVDCCVSVSSALAIFADVANADLKEVLSGQRARQAHVATTIGIHAKSVLTRICAERGVTSRHRLGTEAEMAQAVDAMNKISFDPSLETDC